MMNFEQGSAGGAEETDKGNSLLSFDWLSKEVQGFGQKASNLMQELKTNPETQKQAAEGAAGLAVVAAAGVVTHKVISAQAEKAIVKELAAGLKLEDVTIVPLSKENLPAAVQAAKEGFSYGHGFLNPKPDLVASLEKKMPATMSLTSKGEQNARYFVATDGKGNVFGTTGLYQTARDASDSRWVGWMSVRPDFRGKGIGDQLLQHTIKEARADGATNLRLYTSTAKGEQAAQKLYDKHGLEIVGMEKHPIPGLKYVFRELKLNTGADKALADNADETVEAVEKYIGPKKVVDPEATLSMRELAAKDPAAFEKMLDAYMPKLQQAFPDASEIESQATYREYLNDPDFAWDMHVLRDKEGNVLGGIQSQVLDVGGEKLKKAVWAEHIWLAPEARSFPNFRSLLKTAQGRWAETDSDLVWMEFNDRAKMTLEQQMDDAESGLTPEAREFIWGRVGLNVLGDKSGRVMPYAQPAMGDGEPVNYLSAGFSRLDGKSMAGQTLPTGDYLKLLRAAHGTIPDVDLATDSTVRAYTSAVDKLIANGETEVTFAPLKDTTVERLIGQRFIAPHE